MNPYEILGVDKSATDEEIKKAFRNLSKKYHPDVCKETGAEQRFKDINDAYGILSDPQKRANYDLYGTPDAPPINEAFNTSPFSFDFGYRRRSGESLQYAVSISLYEACFGTKTTISFSHKVACEACNGQGGEGVNKCPSCGGTGVEATYVNMWLHTSPCRSCSGKGNIFRKKCNRCSGTGVANKRESLSITIPAGVCSGETLRVRGKGNVGENGKNPGDLLIQVNILPDSTFKLNGYDIEVEESINIAQAMIGCRKEICLLDRDDEGNPKKIRVNVPAGSSTGTRLRVAGKGFTRKDGRRGDFYIVINVSVPNLSNKRALVEEFANKVNLPLGE